MNNSQRNVPNNAMIWLQTSFSFFHISDLLIGSQWRKDSLGILDTRCLMNLWDCRVIFMRLALSATTHSFFFIIISPTPFWSETSAILHRDIKYKHHTYNSHSQRYTHIYYFLNSRAPICNQSWFIFKHIRKFSSMAWEILSRVSGTTRVWHENRGLRKE